jgi:hypothetical protein
VTREELEALSDRDLKERARSLVLAGGYPRPRKFALLALVAVGSREDHIFMALLEGDGRGDES